MRRTPFILAYVLCAATLAGCGSGGKQTNFPDLSPVKGVVKRGGQPVSGGVIQFMADPEKTEFLTNSEVGTDGTFKLSTVRTTDSKGERKPGAPPGNYKVIYTPSLSDQTAGGQTGPTTIPAPVTVKAGENDITIEVPVPKK
jgi:hypothetical protein